MKIDPAIRLKISHHDLQQIYDAALYAIKNTSSPHIDAHLHPIACFAKAFVDYINVQAQNTCINLSLPERLPYQPSDDE